MLRETKFGYGYLLVGTGLPLLIDRALGLSWGIFASVASVILGGCLIWSGQRHKDGEPRPRWKFWEVLAFIAALCTFIVLASIGILRIMPRNENSPALATSDTTLSGQSQTAATTPLPPTAIVPKPVPSPPAPKFGHVVASRKSKSQSAATSPQPGQLANSEKPGTVEILPPTTSDLHVAVKQAPTQSVTAIVTPRAETKKQQAEPQSGAPAAPVYEAPGGIIIPNNSGIVTSPTVNNYAPPQPNIVATSSPSELQPSQNAEAPTYKTKVTIKTDREANHLSFRFAFDGPYLKADVSDSYTPTIAFSGSSGEMNGHPAFEFSMTYPSTLPVDGEIYLVMYSHQPLKAIHFEKGA